MYIKFFKSSYTSQFLILFLLGILLWSNGFINPQVFPTDTDFSITPFYCIIVNLFGNSNWLPVLFAFLILFFEAVFFNSILINNDLAQKNTLLPALVYLILMSNCIQLLSLHQVLFANFFLIIVLNIVLKIYVIQNAYNLIFNTGFFIAIASFFYFPSIFTIIFIWFSFIVYRIFSWREWLISLLGLLIPYIFLSVYYFWYDSLDIAINNYFSFFNDIQYINLKNGFNIYIYLIWAIIIIFLLISFARLLPELYEKNINVRKKFWVLIWFFLISAISLIFSGNYLILHTTIVFIPISAFIAYYLSVLKKTLRAEIFFGLLVIIILINNLFKF
ncbi:MAG: hypothetical protein K8R58_09010 [Bacteroidales bacterium]|nr:hypothetical protein [Bacteroidales bacterium]